MDTRHTDIHAALEVLATAPDAIQHTPDNYGNQVHWYRLDSPSLIVQAAAIFVQAKARLAMASGYNAYGLEHALQGICYHFEVQGALYNITVLTTEKEPSVPSITPFFRNADWHEREMIELFDLPISGQPNPHRLFLDERLDAGLLNEAIPLSVVMNGASTADLWERILHDRTKAEAAARERNS